MDRSIHDWWFHWAWVLLFRVAVLNSSHRWWLELKFLGARNISMVPWRYLKSLSLKISYSRSFYVLGRMDWCPLCSRTQRLFIPRVLLALGKAAELGKSALAAMESFFFGFLSGFSKLFCHSSRIERLVCWILLTCDSASLIEDRFFFRIGMKLTMLFDNINLTVCLNLCEGWYSIENNLATVIAKKNRYISSWERAHDAFDNHADNFVQNQLFP